MASTKKTLDTNITVTTASESKKVPRSRKVAIPAKTETSVVKKLPSKNATKNLKTDVFDVTGKVVASIALPESLFGANINKTLLAQAVRVYLANQRKGTQSTKTRGEVTGSTRKIYRQKGTGRARHGGIRAPIFVGGGVALGPKPRDFSLTLPQKMRKAALSSALTAKFLDGQIKIVDGFEHIEPKTKTFVNALKKLNLDEKKKKVLLVLPGKNENVQKAARNVEGVSFILANQLNAYAVLNTKTILLMKPAVEVLEKTFGRTD